MNPDSPGASLNPAYHLLFGSLSMDLEPHWRQAALARQRAAVQTLIDTDSSRLRPVLDAVHQLREADRQARLAAEQLLAAPTLWQIVGVGHPAFDSLVQARGTGVRAEARIQWLLGFQTEADLDSLEGLVSGTLQPGDTVYQAAFDDDGNRHYIPGVLVLARATGTALLYWPGSSGGVQAFESLETLSQALLGDPSDDPSTRRAELQWLPLAASYLANSLRGQWQEIQLHAAAITRDEGWYQDAPNRLASMERLRAESSDDLTVGAHPARSQALGLALEEQRTHLLTGALPAWWALLPASDRAALHALLRSYLDAQRECDALMQRDLPARDDLVRRQLRRRVEADFNATGVWHVTLDVPEHVGWAKEPVSAAGAPGTPVRQVPRPSAQRRRLSLEDLAVQAIDEQMALRLDFMQVHVEASDDVTAQALRSGLDKAWLEKAIKELDVAKAYEDALFAAFLGMPGETAEAASKRRQIVAAPWLHRLQWQASSAWLSGRLSETAWQMVHCALHAEQATDWQAPGWDLAMRSAMLTSGDWARLPNDEVGLAGVMLLEERESGLTVVYLPEAPGPRDFFEYPSLAAACLGIANMMLDGKVLEYFAGRPVVGDPAAHAGYIREAQRRNFEGFIKPGPVWPSTTSLARHQANVYLGRLVESHRSTSRSQADLYLESRAIRHGAVFNHIKLAIGMLPFIGVAVSLYDGWNSANAAVEAFLGDRPGEGLDHIESVLLSVIDAGMDVLPATASGLAPGAGWRTRLRQGSARSGAVRHASQPPLSRLQGYEADVALNGLQPASSGRYRGVYQHSDGHFIRQDGRTCRVQWDDSLAIWRLAATPQRGYRQPVVLDDFGQWTTYGALHGQLAPAGAGGGAYLGRLAQEGWAGMAGFLRRRLLGEQTEAARALQLRAELDRHLLLQDGLIARLNVTQARYRQMPDSPEAMEQMTQARRAALDFYQALIDKSLAVLGEKPPTRRFATDFGLAMDNLIHHSEFMTLRLSHDVQEAVKRMRTAVGDDLVGTPEPSAQAYIVDQIKQVYRASSAALAYRVAMEAWINGLRSRRAAQPQLPKLDALLEQSSSALDYRAATLTALSVAVIDPHPSTPAARLALDRYRPLRGELVRSVIAYRELKVGKVVLSSNERHALLDNILRQLRRLEANEFLLTRDTQVFNPTHWQVLRNLVDQFIVEVGEDLLTLESSLTRMTAAKAAARGGKQAGAKRLFETEDDHLLIGSARRTEQGDEVLDIQEPVSGRVLETFSQQAAGKWQSTRPRPVESTFDGAQLPALLDGARKALDEAPALVRHVEELAGRAHVYEPRDLEHMLSGQAEHMDRYAQQLQRLSADRAGGLLQGLRRESQALVATATRIRIAQTKRSLPTGSRMAYLLERGEARIERLGGRIGLRNARGRISDYLQEYAVLDTSTGKPLWYAHFHYEKADAPFANFARAHLKTLKQRKQGRHSQMLQEQSGHTVTPLWRERLVSPFIEPFAALG